MAEKGASFIPIEDFRPDYHDPDEWLGRFEKAVVLATNCGEDRKKELYVAWLPMKLNDATRLMMSDALSAATAATWANLKTQFKSLLITPQDKYNWRSRRKRITWDGQENFHTLAARVKRTIDRYEDSPSEADYYHEFRSALPRNYQQAIDLGHNAETLAEGKRIAFRCQAALTCTDDGDGAADGKSFAFVGGAMSCDPLTSIERGFQEISLKLDDLEAKVCGPRMERSSCSRPSRHNPADDDSQNDFLRRGARRDHVHEGHNDRNFGHPQDHFHSHGYRRNPAQEVTGQLHQHDRDQDSHSHRQYNAGHEQRSDQMRHEDRPNQQRNCEQYPSARRSELYGEEYNSQDVDFQYRGHRRDRAYEGHDDRNFGQPQDHSHSHGHRRSHAQEVTGQLHHQQRDHYSHSRRHDNASHKSGDNHY